MSTLEEINLIIESRLMHVQYEMLHYVLVKKRFYYGEVELGGSNKNCHSSFEGPLSIRNP